MKKIFLILLCLPTLFLLGCVDNTGMFRLDKEYLAVRTMETRNFDTKKTNDVLSASAQVLQDLGFTITETETKLGLITANKDRTAGSTGAMVFNIFMGGQNARYDVKQRVFANIIVLSANGGHTVRAKFARIVWDNRGDSRVEQIDDAGTYRDFFDKLSQSLFLAANDV